MQPEYFFDYANRAKEIPLIEYIPKVSASNSRRLNQANNEDIE